MAARDLTEPRGDGIAEAATDRRWVLAPVGLAALQGRLARPLWGLMGIWATLCGALASNGLRWVGRDLQTLILVVILVDLAWGSLWDLADGTDWQSLWTAGLPHAVRRGRIALPYTQPGSPAEWLYRRAGRIAAWWREVFWPAAGLSLVGLVASGSLAAVLTLLLPDRVAPLNAILLLLLGLGVVQRWRGRVPLAGQALAMVGLSWLAGHAAFSGISQPSIALALCFSLATWGGLLLGAGQRGGLWLLDGAQVAVVVLLTVLKQPVAAGLVGILFFGQLILQPSLHWEVEPARVVRRTWLWLLVSMIGAALAIP